MNLLKIFDIEGIMNWYNTYTENSSVWGIIRLCLDISLAIGLIVFVLVIFKIKLRNKKLYFVVFAVLVIIAALFFLRFSISIAIIRTLLFWLLGVIFIIYSNNIRNVFEHSFRSKKRENIFETEEEKDRVIEILVSSCVWLSKRKTGALIVIEREESLDSFIHNAIVLEAKLSQELLTSLFYVGTDTHDGAIIIRKNKIMCAAAYLPATDKYNIPKTLGTRHRAAIGISERTDAFTIVVSEETGKITSTFRGNYEPGLTEESLKIKLKNMLSASNEK